MNYLPVFVFLLGACVGSFLNVCIYRIPLGKSVVSPPSHCMSCENRLGFPELIPILGYLLLRGRCKYCGATFSCQYPLVELFTALAYTAVWFRFGYTWLTLAMWVFMSILIAASVIDYYHQIIHNRLVLIGLVVGVPLIALQSWDDLKSGLMAFLAAGLFLLAIAVVSRGGMGGGDIKLGAMMGLYLGLTNLAIAFFLAFLIGGVTGLVLMLAKRKGRKDAVPFGPFLSLGALLAVFWGENIASWYCGFWF